MASCATMSTRMNCSALVLASALLSLLSIGCAYPRRSTTVQPAQLTREAMADLPEGLWTLTLVSAEVPQDKRTGLPWDSDGTGPDPVVRLLINGRQVWESPVKENQNTPEWNITLPRNVEINSDDDVRLELWDQDQATVVDPVGFLRHRGLPGNALPDAVARVALDTPGAVITLIASRPRPHRGTGISSYEQRPDALLIVAVDAHSPAARAGIAAGDWIMSIDGKSVEGLGNGAVGMISMAAERGYSLVVRNAEGHDREVNLDRGFIWQTL